MLLDTARVGPVITGIQVNARVDAHMCVHICMHAQRAECSSTVSPGSCFLEQMSAFGAEQAEPALATRGTGASAVWAGAAASEQQDSAGEGLAGKARAPEAGRRRGGRGSGP